MPDEAPHHPRITITVTDHAGDVVFETWQDAVPRWRNVFMIFGGVHDDAWGRPVGESLWDVPDPNKTWRLAERLEHIIRAIVRVNDTPSGAIADVEFALDAEHAATAARVLGACKPDPGSGDRDWTHLSL